MSGRDSLDDVPVRTRRPSLAVSYTATASGRGSGPNVGELKDFLEAIPPTATTSVSTDSGDQRDPSTWRIAASWSQGQHEEWLRRDSALIAASSYQGPER